MIANPQSGSGGILIPPPPGRVVAAEMPGCSGRTIVLLTVAAVAFAAVVFTLSYIIRG